MSKHQPVLLQEAIAGLVVKPGNWYVDATFGRGGHTSAILAAGGNVIAFDVDADAIAYAQQTMVEQLQHQQLILVHENFTHLEEAVTKLQQASSAGVISGVLFDFGTSTEQLTSSSRGFSFTGDGPLDMRMDHRLGVTAADLLQVLPEKQLTELFREYGGEHESRGIARAIVRQRQQNPAQLQSVQGLVNVILATKREKRSHLHPATKVFQALRIAVNDELAAIREALPQALRLLEHPGRVVTIAFHEGEDRLVKRAFLNWETAGKGEVVTKKPINPSEEEVLTNPRSRSAKLRIFAV